MTKVILYVCGLAASVAIAVWFANEPGAVTLDWLGWRIDTSVAVLFVIVLALLLIGTFLIKSWNALMGAGRALKEARKEKRLNKGLTALAAGFAAIRGEDIARAETAARDASTAIGEHQAVRFLKEQVMMLKDSKQAAPDARELVTDQSTELAALRDLVQIALDANDFEGALTHVKRVLDRKAPPKWALASALDIQIALSRWQDAITTLSRKDIQTVFSDTEVKRLKTLVCHQAAVAALANQDYGTAVKLARHSLAADAAHTEAAATLARALNGEGKAKKALAELEKAWAVSPHPSLLAAFVELAPGESALARASRIETLVAKNPGHPESCLAAAQASLAAELWGQARNRLEPLLDEAANAHHRSKAAALMAQVELSENGNAKAATENLLLALEAKNRSSETPTPTSAADLLALQS